jgi:hypothetical protein
MNENFRLIANPYLLKKDINKHNKHNNDIINNKENLLKKNIENYFNMELEDKIYADILLDIEKLINDYKLKLFVSNFIDDCIKNVISNLKI